MEEIKLTDGEKAAWEKHFKEDGLTGCGYGTQINTASAFKAGVAAGRATVVRVSETLASLQDSVKTFDGFSIISRTRCEHPEGFNHKLNSWSLSDWITATVGELGEAANVAKKLNRVRDNVPGNDKTEDELRAMLKDEIADTFIYLDLLAQSQRIRLGEAVREKFDKTSAKMGYPVRLLATPPAIAPPPRIAVAEKSMDVFYTGQKVTHVGEGRHGRPLYQTGEAKMISRIEFERNGRRVEEIVVAWDGEDKRKLLWACVPFEMIVVNGVKNYCVHIDFVWADGQNEQNEIALRDARGKVREKFDEYWANPEKA